MSPPMPREEVYRLYWYFASERHAIFERRVQGLPAPWTVDPILHTFKFCNVYRAADRVSQFLIRDVAYASDCGDPADRIFQIIAFRIFSKIETWRGIRAFLGRTPRIADLASGALLAALEWTRERNGGLYTGAFILCATDAYGQGLKHRNHVALFRDMFLTHRVADQIGNARTLKSVYDILHAFPLMGDFMSYQIAVDLNYSDLLAFGENDFTVPGPGAHRGIRKVFEDLGDFTPEDAIQWMVERQKDEFMRYGLPFGGLWGRPLHAIDCQGLFCEVDKYCREAVPALPSARKRIKARYSKQQAPIQLFFPPKWGINHLLPREPVFAQSQHALL